MRKCVRREGRTGLLQIFAISTSAISISATSTSAISAWPTNISPTSKSDFPFRQICSLKVDILFRYWIFHLMTGGKSPSLFFHVCFFMCCFFMCCFFMCRFSMCCFFMCRFSMCCFFICLSLSFSDSLREALKAPSLRIVLVKRVLIPILKNC